MADEHVILGKISGVHGVKGWLKVFSNTRPIDNLFQYSGWQLKCETGEVQSFDVLNYRQSGKKLLVQLDGVNDRVVAEGLVGFEILIDPSQLPVLEDEYYWRDLIGLTVKDQLGLELGKIVDLMETGSNDVLLLKDNQGKSLAIPWIPDVISEVDLKQSILIVDWEPLV